MSGGGGRWNGGGVNRDCMRMCIWRRDIHGKGCAYGSSDFKRRMHCKDACEVVLVHSVLMRYCSQTTPRVHVLADRSLVLAEKRTVRTVCIVLIE